MHSILITGGAGFIGSHLTRLFVTKYPHYNIVNLDVLTYAGNLENLKDIEDKPNYSFIKGNITDLELIKSFFINKYQFFYKKVWINRIKMPIFVKRNYTYESSY